MEGRTGAEEIVRTLAGWHVRTLERSSIKERSMQGQVGRFLNVGLPNIVLDYSWENQDWQTRRVVL